MGYYISRTHHSLHDSATAWEPCSAKTLRGAKRQAINGKSYLDYALHIGTESGRVDVYTGDPEIITIATRSNCYAGTRWIN